MSTCCGEPLSTHHCPRELRNFKAKLLAAEKALAAAKREIAIEYGKRLVAALTSISKPVKPKMMGVSGALPCRPRRNKR